MRLAVFLFGAAVRERKFTSRTMAEYAALFTGRILPPQGTGKWLIANKVYSSNPKPQ